MKSLYYATITSALFLVVIAPLLANDFESIESGFDREFSAIEESARASMEAIEAEYDAFQAQVEAEYDDFKGEVGDLWGEADVVVNDRYRWVEYGDDRLSRSVVDFESGEVEIELLLTDEEMNDASLFAQKVDEAKDRLITSRGSSVEYESKYLPNEEVSTTPIMEDLIDVRSTAIIRDEQVERPTSVAVDRVATAKLEQEVIRLREEAARLASTPAPTSDVKISDEGVSVTKVQTIDGERNVVKVKSNLDVGYLGTLARRYETSVLANAQRFNISATLIFAIMETESYFNPTATSHVPAYGLMQIVPKYAGRDAYRYLYGEDKIVSKDYLYQAEKNIEMGTCFLHLLATRYFNGVTEPRCRELCMIAAYNTGPGNVSRAMVGHTNVFKSISQINAMSYDELYAHLRRHLPYTETQNYIERVTTKRAKYSSTSH